MPRPQPADLWDVLNPRQRIYLTAIYSADQGAEARNKGGAFDWGHGPPASEWRWQTFCLKASKEFVGRTSIQYELARKGEHDQGAGSSLAALRRRALIELMEDYVEVFPLGMVPRVRVKLTTLGRATARAGLGHTAPKSPPRGMLSEWLWSNLVRLYRAGPGGMATNVPRGTPQEERPPSEKARLFLERDRRHGKEPFIETKRIPTGEPYESPVYAGHMIYPSEQRIFLTEAGQAHYEQHVRCYAELWPDVDAPVPNKLPDTAHASLDDHKVRKPRGLLDRAPYVLLVAIVHNDLEGELWLRRQGPQGWKAELEKLPSGITHPHLVTRSTAAPTKLLQHRGGPLAAETSVPHWLDPDAHRRTGALRILHVTDAGRAHYATHLETYRGLYGDVDTPDAPAEWSTISTAHDPDGDQ
ncbi:hypothetical protein ABTY59_32175 [Streptomyces sp. NPDC096079]|uniref:hypothetical protein n=1 Tax=Streptomyces sp. NPDC096079 TaxID=3155820 RepID=UPI00331667E9